MAQTIAKTFLGTSEVHLTKCVSSKGVTFRNGMIVAHGSTSGLPNLGEVVQICIVQESLCFIVKRLTGNIPEPLS